MKLASVQLEQGSPTKRRTFIRRAAIAVAVLTIWILANFGCSTPEQRYRVLAFFFDGVPVPPSMLKDMPELMDPTDRAALEAEAAQSKQQSVTYYHEPYVTRDCFGCHDRQKGFQAQDNGADSCRKCHAAYFHYEPDDWVHGPVALKECRMCHRPHKSEHRDLLTEPQTDLCLNCHQPELLDETYHATARAGVDRCGKCHDPHLAGNRTLLVDSRTYANRRLAGFRPQSVHKPFVEKQCAACHVIEEGNRVVDDIDAACASCHQTVIDAAAAPGFGVHQAVADGKCIHCHNPHDSPRPHLLRVTAEKMCNSCHSPSDLQAANHPGSIIRADCLICHTGHTSERPHLLRAQQESLP